MTDFTIDGSYGEGGGQIIRNSIAWAEKTGTSILIKDIRKNRNKGGLSHQHLKALELVRDITGAHIEGLFLYSTEVSYYPLSKKNIKNDKNTFVCLQNTAGSISLIIQQVLPLPYTFDVQFNGGGTDVPFSPPSKFIRHVLMPILGHFNYTIDKPGFYPKGGASASLSKNIRRNPIILNNRGTIVFESFVEKDYFLIKTDTGCVFYGADRQEALAQFNSGACVDEYLADQLLVYMDVPESIMIVKFPTSSHFDTALHIAQKFTYLATRPIGDDLVEVFSV